MFIAVTLDSKHEIFIVYIALVTNFASLHPFYRPQIVGLITKKAFTKVSIKYTDFANVFFLDLASVLSDYTGINNQVIELVND